MSEDVPDRPPGGELVLYRTEDGRTRLECRFDEETIWLSQALIAELFQISIPNVNMHLKNVFAEGELGERATIKDYLIVRQEGARTVSRKVHPLAELRPFFTPHSPFFTLGSIWLAAFADLLLFILRGYSQPLAGKTGAERLFLGPVRQGWRHGMDRRPQFPGAE